MFEMVAGERLRTTFAGMPSVALEGTEGRGRWRLRFDSSAVDDEGMNWQTELLFLDVLDLRLHDFELGLDRSDPDDFAYALIRLVDSSRLREFAEQNALSRTAMPRLKDENLQHYRLAFDDHGTYDIVCTSVEISYERVRSYPESPR